MSTKIHNGYRIDGPFSLQWLTPRLRGFGVLARAEVDRLFFELVTSLAVQAIDATALGRPMPWKCRDRSGVVYPLHDAREHVVERQEEIRKTRHRDPEVDFECKVCLIPYGDHVYALLYTEKQTLREVWERTEGVREYPYWNNTDPPDGVTDREWEARGMEWDEAIGKEGVPSYVGLTFDADHAYMPFVGRENAARFLAGVEFRQRVDQWAADILQDEWCGPRMKAAGAAVHEWTRIFFEFRDWLKTDEGRARLAEKREAVAAKLKADLTVDDLYAPLTPVQSPKPEGRS